MFQEIIASGRADSRRPWTFAVSLLSQAAAVSIVALGSIVISPALPVAGWTAVLLAPAPPPPPAPPAAPAARPISRPTPRRFEGLVQPTRMPDKAHLLIDDPADLAEAAPPSSPAGVMGGTRGGVKGAVVSFLPENLASPVAPPPPPAPEPPPTAPVRISSDLQAARLIRRIEPRYPALAIQTRTQGTVKLQAIIAADGSIERLQTLSGHPLLVPAALHAVRQWRYRPTLLSGNPVSVVTQIEVHFRLR